MTATKKSIRFLTVIILTIAMVLSVASVPASAAGVETWYRPYTTEKSFDMNGYNITPVKTMGEAGYLHISVSIHLTDLASKPGTAYLIAEIRSTSGAVLGRETGITYPVGDILQGYERINVSAKVTKGQKVQIYFGVYDSSNNSARTASCMYSHEITEY